MHIKYAAFTLNRLGHNGQKGFPSSRLFPVSASAKKINKNVSFEWKFFLIIQIKSSRGRWEEQWEEARCSKSWSSTSVIAQATVE